MKKFEFTQDYEGNKKGDVIGFNIETYHGFQHPLLMKGILINTEENVNKKQTVNENVNMDLNKDGIVDKKDISIAGKVLQQSKKSKRVN